ncbi:MAG TPA: hypothetical protein HA360_00610 [Nanoarchaeota archaeon]|nr:hypothetical protein [Candidatus Woesearchaeota archaeon]HIH15386.1 hypothetical protein [Nanoarchaeota archaeon]HIH58373.1 hypothetical protein [Nanoarchaeota archaeon]HII13554.1 hypothetical protein [Nanoarchaeota archaeon]HIJ05624.1 hypothetical protein [Nanoarchaeota archaeon]
MKRIIFLSFLLLILVPLISAEDCDDFCLDKDYTYGACRETTENKGFCEGKNEDVYGFSSCENYERCCCGFEVEEESSGDVEENSSNDASSETVDKGPLAENLFLPLILLVILLALAVLLKKKAFRREEEKKDEEIKEE